jgi:cytochrome P450
METFNPGVNVAIKCITHAEEQGLEESEKQDDLLTGFQKIAKAGGKGGTYGAEFGRADIVNHTSTNVLVGSDTTAIALRSMIHNLITYPVAYRKLQQEIDDFESVGNYRILFWRWKVARCPTCRLQ